MFDILDKDLRISVLVLEDNPNTYYLSYKNDTKCVIDTMYEGNNLVIIPDPKEHCTAEELDIIIDRFSSYIFNIKPEINGILFKTDPDPMLDNIGFKQMSENSEYLYKENKRINKVR